MFYRDFYAAAWMGQEGGGGGEEMDGITVNSPTVQLADANSPTYTRFYTSASWRRRVGPSAS